ncbi:Hypothetical predicted protein [Mytilus galloprovincialis]|uniref:Uncharacterized protein n=1 Tax=Mytilus galloprovincialis TaxID=29158 RepID=A0A8B6HCJ7_MYTGA|nr:Hypothetical predicted protein [Mytilus galloprovincialis]
MADNISNTDDPGNSETEDEWFEAEDDIVIDEDAIEKSSDEIKVDNPFHVYKLNKDIGRIKKICPINYTDAWVLADRKLFKMTNQYLEDTVYADDADDIVVLKDGCVLILRIKNTIIIKLLTNRRLLRFANVGNNSMLPYCFCSSIDDLLTVYFSSQSCDIYGNYESCVVHIVKNGIITGQFNISTFQLEKPYIMHFVKSALCILYVADNLRVLNNVKLFEKAKYEYIEAKYFNGIIGYNPTQNFESHGICSKKGNIFESDIRHHSVYALDKNLKYTKCEVDARDGLDKPTAIAIYSDYLWIADGDQILNLDLNHTNYNELHFSRYSTLNEAWKWITNLISNLFGIGKLISREKLILM